MTLHNFYTAILPDFFQYKERCEYSEAIDQVHCGQRNRAFHVIDESVIPVIDNEKHKTRKGYEWCLRDGITGDVVFHYDRGSRSGKVARELLGNYVGLAQCDGYDAYEQFERMKGITLFGCWAHARRKFTEALDAGYTGTMPYWQAVQSRI